MSLFFCAWRLDSNGATGADGRFLKRPYVVIDGPFQPSIPGANLPPKRAAGAAAPTEKMAGFGWSGEWAEQSSAPTGGDRISEERGRTESSAPTNGFFRLTFVRRGWASPPHPSASPTPSPRGEGGAAGRVVAPYGGMGAVVSTGGITTVSFFLVTCRLVSQASDSQLALLHLASLVPAYLAPC